ncbi:hypothetical protein [Methylophilus luteus]|uniref:Uncharacterized protein n=1 Tax=Methylophilus luteus TaxID=640108 RepID=A0ABW3F876_9PROT
MSASYKSNDTFDAQEFAVELCKAKKVILASSECSFQRGWSNIFEVFIECVGRYPIVLLEVKDENGFLEIDVHMRSTTRAKQIYTSVMTAKYNSKRQCAHCGDIKPPNERKYCASCSDAAVMREPTGTWLDKFR